MAFQEITMQAKDIKKYPNTPLTGFYEGVREISTPLGQQFIYDLETQDGKHISIYGFTSLNSKMSQVNEGDLVRITYAGQVEAQTKFGKKMVHQCTVEVDHDAAVNRAISNVSKAPEVNSPAPEKEAAPVDKLPW